MVDLFFRIFQHLLPDSLAFRIRKGTTTWSIGDGSAIGDPGLLIGGKPGGRDIDRFWWALAHPFAVARQFIDLAYLDLFPDTTREIEAWEDRFGLLPATTEDDRRANISASWQATGGQSADYLQTIFQAAGFAVYVHEWFNTPSPYDPRAYTQDPLVGTVQCGEPIAKCGEPDALCNGLLANNVGYLQNGLLDGKAPPAIPTNPDAWRYFLYIGGQTFPNTAQVPAVRRQEFERLILKLRPSQQWLVALVDYV